MSDIEVVHLVWAAAGLEPFRRFLSSYREYPGGLDHGLVILYNGFSADALGEHRALLDGIPHRELRLPFMARDLRAYVWAAERCSARHLCFINSYSTLLAGGWLRALNGYLVRPGVGAAGATGSWESFYSNYLRRLKELGRPSSPLAWARHVNRLRKLRRYRANFDPAPNPHLRSNAFMIERSRWLSLERSSLKTKWQTWLFESGKRSMTAQLSESGLKVYVVGRDGEAYAQDRWPLSGTFRLGNQENLLVADNRTRQYDEADEDGRRYMREIAWGAD
jgi:hypothetical protein